METTNRLVSNIRRIYVTSNGRHIERRDDLGPGYWTAESDRGIKEYLVIMNPDFQYCTCPDQHYRGRVCKHMLRITEVD